MPMKRTLKMLLACSLTFTALALTTLAAKIPPFFVDCVVALGREDGTPPKWATEASGFLYGVPADQETDPAKHQYSVYLVTNRHVLENHAQITLRLNSQKETNPVREFTLFLKNSDGTDLWVSHPNPLIDVSVVHLNGAYLREQGLQSSFFSADLHVADKAKMQEIGTSIGDEVFVLGFPMGISGTLQRNYVIARRGTIARIEDTLNSNSPTFLIDAFIFPGNSGGPVVSVPDLNFIAGTKAQNKAYLIGMVRGYLPYTDIAVSQQTGQPRMVSQENSGLAEVIPVDYINETIQAASEAEKKRHP
jgi:S1-C subfamily serine protease